MKGRVVFLFVLAVAAFAVPAAAATSTQDGCTPPEEAPVGTEVEPGGSLVEAVGAQESELAGELVDRRFESRLANATTDEERAEVIAAEVGAIANRLTDLEERCQDLMDARSDGEVGDDTYRTRLGRLAIQVRAVDCRVNRTEREATTLPVTLREEYNVTEETFATLESRVDELNATVAGDSARVEAALLGSFNATEETQTNACGVEELAGVNDGEPVDSGDDDESDDDGFPF